jgi:hypothetical protein
MENQVALVLISRFCRWVASSTGLPTPQRCCIGCSGRKLIKGQPHAGRSTNQPAEGFATVKGSSVAEFKIGKRVSIRRTS